MFRHFQTVRRSVAVLVCTVLLPLSSAAAPRSAPAAVPPARPEPPPVPVAQTNAVPPKDAWTPATPQPAPPPINAIAMDGPPLDVGTSVVIATANGVFRSTNGGSNWESWTDGIESRSIASVVYAKGRFYALAGGQVYRRDAKASNWAEFATGLPAERPIREIVTDGSSVVVSESYNYTSTQPAILKASGDGWTDLSATLPITTTEITAIAVSKTGIYIGTSVYTTGTYIRDLKYLPLNDAAGGWQSIKGSTLPLATNSVTAIAVDNITDEEERVYASLSGNQGVWYNYCPPPPTPTPTPPPPPLRSLPLDTVVPTPYASLSTAGLPSNSAAGPPSNNVCWSSLNYSGVPNDIRGLSVVSGGDGANRTVDLFAITSGALYIKRSSNPYWFRSGASNRSVTAIALSPDAVEQTEGDSVDGVLFAGTSNGMLRSSDVGYSFNDFNAGLAVASAIGLLVSADDGTLVAANTTNLFRSEDLGSNWANLPVSIYEPSALAVSPNYGVNGRMYAAISYNYSATKGIGYSGLPDRNSIDRIVNAPQVAQYNYGNSILFSSLDRGATWINHSAPYQTQFILPFTRTTSEESLYLGQTGLVTETHYYTSGVRISDDYGESSRSINNGLIGQHLNTLVLGVKNQQHLLLAGTQTGVYRWNQTSWQSFVGGDLAPNTNIKQIAFSPKYAADDGAFALGESQAYRLLTSEPPSWHRLPSLPTGVISLTVSPDFGTDNIVFAQSATAIYVSRDAGETWAAVTSRGLPENTKILAFAVSADFANDRAIFIGTDGAGIFRYTLPPPAPPWLVLLYLGGQDNQGDLSLDESIRQMLERLRGMEDPNTATVRVVALYDGNSVGDSVVYVRDNQGEGLRQILDLPPELANNELDTGSVSTLQNFIRWSRDTYPGSIHTMLSIVDHGGGWAPDFGTPGQARATLTVQSGGWRGMSLDVSESDNATSLSTRETGKALRDLGELGKFDIIFFDACLMGMIETAYEIQPYTKYFIAGENVLWARLPYERYLAKNALTKYGDRGLKRETTPSEFARNIVDIYDDATKEHYAIAAVDTDKLTDLRNKTNVLAKALASALGSTKPLNETVRQRIQDAYFAAQHFDYDASLEIDPQDGYVDLGDFARKLGEQQDFSPEIYASAKQVTVLFDSVGEGSLILNRHQKSPDDPSGEGKGKNLENAQGLAIYLPLGEKDCRPTGIPGQRQRTDDLVTCLLPDSFPGPDPQESKGLAVEPQLSYYRDPEQLRFAEKGSGDTIWADLLVLLEHDTPRREIARKDYPNQWAYHAPLQLRTDWRYWLPVVVTAPPAPDLVVTGIQVLPDALRVGQPAEVRVTIKNTGNLDATQPFWVDLYVDPQSEPQPGQPWPDISPYGIAWRVPVLGVGDLLTLSSLQPDDPGKPGSRYSNFKQFVRSGEHTLYARVDSYAAGQVNGAVAESNEQNNLGQPKGVIVAASGR